MKMPELCRARRWLSDKSLNFISFPLREHPRHPRLKTPKIEAQRGPRGSPSEIQCPSRVSKQRQNRWMISWEDGTAMVKTARAKTGGPLRAGTKSPPAAALPETVESALDRVAYAVTQGIRSGIFVPGQHLLEPELTRRIG